MEVELGNDTDDKEEQPSKILDSITETFEKPIVCKEEQFANA